MKKVLLFLTCLLTAGYVLAEDKLIVEDVSVPQGGQATITIACDFQTAFTDFQMDVVINGAARLVMDSSGDPECEVVSTKHSVSGNKVSDGHYRFVAFSFPTAALPSNGALLKLQVKAPEGANVGDTYTATITNALFSDENAAQAALADVTFNITVADKWTVLDETSAEVPAATDVPVDIKVKRTIKANEWSTICLPFSMTEAQVKEAFGDDVELAEYIEHEANDELTEITVYFDAADLSGDGLMANYPYIIKTSQDITEFTTQAVVEPDEEAAVAEFTNGRTGSRREVYGTFVGTLHAGVTIPENNLFLNGGKFWYSAGKTVTKAFRAYFDLNDVLANVNDAATKVNIAFGGKTTGISSMSNGTVADGAYYSLQGIRVTKPGKGIYVKDGKKIIVK